jgi:molybdenum cofactor cytidylyltransferase
VKFATLALADAEGAILAHTLRLGRGRALKKGRLLSAADVEALRAAGRERIVAAKLEAGDVHEDTAARALAERAAGPGLRVAAPFTGRCNLHALEAGVLVVDPARIDRINAVDEALTIATLAPYARVSRGELAVTVKVIPFAVREEQLAAALRAAEGPEPPVRVAPFVPAAAGVILTQVPGLSARVLDRAAESQRARMERLGGSVKREIRCAHDEDNVARAIEELLTAGCSPILILGASAIVDRRDVIPSAVERAGGRLDQLGMPVDPGNLLLLARHGVTPVIGLPGCARSTKASGADWVLERTLAGIPVGPRDLRAMGVGGLLKELPRPQPRERGTPVRRPRVGAVVLAAGLSRRMGERNKLLAEIDDTPMVARSVDAVLASSARPVVVVIGHEAERVRAALAGRDVRFVHAPEYERGMSRSLAAGIEALGASVDAALICLGDMPRVRAQDLDTLIAAFASSEDGTICVPTHAGKRGNPVLWPARYFEEITAREGDVGARALLETHAQDVRSVPIDDAGIVFDIDTPEELP